LPLYGLCLAVLIGSFFCTALSAAYSSFNRRHHTKKQIEYVFFDLGASRLPAESLSKHALPLSQAPCINNAGQVVYNDLTGGYLWDPIQGAQRLPWNGVYARFHGINSDGTVLASVVDPQGRQNWMLWSAKCGYRQTPTSVDLPCQDQACIYFRAIHDNGMLSGMVKYNGDTLKDTYAVVWPGNGQLYTLGKGIAWSISASGYTLANDATTHANSPYLWHRRGGFLILADHSCFHKPANVRYVDMLLDYDGSVYGTFFHHSDPDELQGFHWDPHSNTFDLLELCGMRISAVNTIGTLVGSLRGRAIARYRDTPPLDLTELIEVKGKRWQLIEATDINDLGQIVGYGSVDGQTHIFLLQPLEHPTLKIYRKK
jgi:hypothetical protein